MFRHQTSDFVNAHKKIYGRGNKYSWNIQAISKESAVWMDVLVADSPHRTNSAVQTLILTIWWHTEVH